MLNTIELTVEVGTEQFMNPDLFIASDGAAGLVIAIVAADGGLSVVVSYTRYPPIDTACGKDLVPDAIEALPYLGVDPFFTRSLPLHSIRFLGTGSNPRASFPHGVRLGIWRTVLLRSLLLRHAEQPVSVSSGTQPSEAIRQTPLLRLCMIETCNQLDIFSEKGTANARPGPRLPI
jgi:hypothetical protein